MIFQKYKSTSNILVFESLAYLPVAPRMKSKLHAVIYNTLHVFWLFLSHIILFYSLPHWLYFKHSSSFSSEVLHSDSSCNTLDPDLLRIDSFTPFSFQLMYHPLGKTFSGHLPKIVSAALPWAVVIMYLQPTPYLSYNHACCLYWLYSLSNYLV